MARKTGLRLSHLIAAGGSAGWTTYECAPRPPKAKPLPPKAAAIQRIRAARYS